MKNCARALLAGYGLLLALAVNARAEVICNANVQPTNIRSGPGAKDYAVVDKLANGVEVKVQDHVVNAKGFTWAKIEFPHSQTGAATTGYVMGEAVSTECSTTEANGANAQSPAPDSTHSGDSNETRALLLAYRGLSRLGRNDDHPTEEDKAAAFADFTKSAKLGDKHGQYYLGMMYVRGDGVQEDLATGVKWLLKSAEQGFPDAQYRAGLACLGGHGVAKDPQAGIAWVQKAASQGNEEAVATLKKLQ